jgi:BirA family transcriptional regulator, biotin operon repressor / biotin---[acetyl-CoA-carboxylase] ligase
VSALGTPHLHLRATSSTSDRARALAQAGAPHGTLVTAGEQSAGRGRQGRSWSAPAGSSLLMSVVLRDPPDLLPLAAGIAVARACGERALIKWPNDVLLDDRKVAGILAEGRPQEGWAILGIGVNVALDVAGLPPELHATAATLGLSPGDIPGVLDRLLRELETTLVLDDWALLAAYRELDALLGRPISWSGGTGIAAGIDGSGRLVVDLPGWGVAALEAGEVHLVPASPSG